ncbi:hypothetical protein FACS189418_7880 [Clostridia bacterium]|nr:hypothetical protein FACS189418_7880 [Clostridia bacterium]
MIDTQQTFEARKKELEVFLINMKRIDEENSFPMDFSNMLHSNVILMLYNLVESTVLGGILEIYDALKSENMSYLLINEELRTVWFSYMFNQVYDKNAHHNSYKKKVSEIIKAILNNQVIALDRRAVEINGNLDADQIRKICNLHGITFAEEEEKDKSKGGYHIKTVKDLRNDLAHGLKSFVEVGQNYTHTELNQIFEETVSFLEGIIKGMKQYYSSKKWKIESVSV